MCINARHFGHTPRYRCISIPLNGPFWAHKGMGFATRMHKRSYSGTPPFKGRTIVTLYACTSPRTCTVANMHIPFCKRAQMGAQAPLPGGHSGDGGVARTPNPGIPGSRSRSWDPGILEIWQSRGSGPESGDFGSIARIWGSRKRVQKGGIPGNPGFQDIHGRKRARSPLFCFGGGFIQLSRPAENGLFCAQKCARVPAHKRFFGYFRKKALMGPAGEIALFGPKKAKNGARDPNSSRWLLWAQLEKQPFFGLKWPFLGVFSADPVHMSGPKTAFFCKKWCTFFTCKSRVLPEIPRI